MPKRAADLCGETFSLLTAEKRTKSPRGRTAYECRCACGNTVVVEAHRLKSGNTRSCGCMIRSTLSSRNKARARHGQTYSGTWKSWHSMLQRCTYPGHHSYHHYKNVPICEQWFTFENFLADMGERPIGASIDRIDNRKGYSPDNCRWATTKEQGNNRSSNCILYFDGRSQNIAQWAEEIGMSRQALGYRIRAGWSVDDALTISPTRSNRWRTH